MIIDSDELYAFYASIGEAVYAIQCVEGSLQQIICIKGHFEKQRPTSDEANEILGRSLTERFCS